MKPSTYSMIATLKADLLIEGATDIILADTPAKLMQKLTPTLELCSRPIKVRVMVMERH